MGIHGQMAMVDVSPVYLWRSIAGILIAFNMVVRDNYVGGNLIPSYGARIYDSDNKLVRTENTDVDDEAFVRNYRFTTISMFESVDSIEWIKLFMTKAFSVTNKFQQERGQILNGAYWLYEMEKSSSPYTRLFNGAIALDALIPVPQKSTDDRFIPWRSLFLAEAIAESVSESRKISKEMDNFLKIRNGIIHGNDLQVIYEPGNLDLIVSVGDYIQRYLRKRLMSFVSK